MLIRTTPFLLAIFILAAGCQTATNKDVSTFGLDAAIVGASETSHTSSRDAYGKTEVIAATGSQGSVSVAFISTNTKGVIADTGEAPRLFLKGWIALKDKKITYGQNAQAGGIAYERFSFAGNDCFHFHQPMMRSLADDMARYTQILAGYVCVDEGVEKSAADIASFLGAIVVPSNAASIYEKDALPVTLFKPLRPLRTRLSVEIPIDPAD